MYLSLFQVTESGSIALHVKVRLIADLLYIMFIKIYNLGDSDNTTMDFPNKTEATQFNNGSTTPVICKSIKSVLYSSNYIYTNI